MTTPDISVTITAAQLEVVLETAFGGDLHVTRTNHPEQATRTNAFIWTIAFGDGHPGDLTILHVNSESMSLGSLVFVTELAPGALRHTESNVLEGRAYRFKLAAKNSAGRSAPSAARTVLAANLPFATPAPVITDVSGTKISLSWDAPNANFVHESGSPITGSVGNFFFLLIYYNIYFFQFYYYVYYFFFSIACTDFH